MFAAKADQSSSDEPIHEQILEAYPEDARAQRVVVTMGAPANERPEWITRWAEHNGFLHYEGKVYIPDGVRLKAMDLCHDDPLAGHFGTKRTLELIRRQFYWPKMLQDVKGYVRSCQACARSKATRHKRFGVYTPLPVPKGPWTDLTLDFITELPKGTYQGQSYDSILVVVDRFTKMSHYIPTRSTMKASDLAEVFLREIIRLHGVPESIVSDRGTLFTSEFWSTFCYYLGVKRKLSTAFHPQTDRQTERQNQTLEQYLRVYSNYEQDNWARLLPQAEFAYNNSEHQGIGTTPFCMAYGIDPSLGIWPNKDLETREQRLKRRISPKAEEIATKLVEIRANASKCLEKARAYQIKYLNEDKEGNPIRNNVKFGIGDMVYLDARNISTKRPKKKLDYKYFGPYKVLEQIGTQAYKLDLPPSLAIHPVFHVSLLEPFRPDEQFRRKQATPMEVVGQEGQDIYEVDHIIEKKWDKDHWKYRVRWKDYQSDEDTWEPATNISTSAMRAYEKNNLTGSRPKGGRMKESEPNESTQRRHGRGRPPKRRRMR
jgi:transposase InsO family protein